MEPVKDGAADQRREHAGANAELVPHGREAQHNVQVLANLVDEKGPAVLRTVEDAWGETAENLGGRMQGSCQLASGYALLSTPPQPRQPSTATK